MVQSRPSPVGPALPIPVALGSQAHDFPSAQRVRIVAFGRPDVARAAGAAQQGQGNGRVLDVSGRQNESEWSAERICERMDLGGLAPARGADRLRPRPHFSSKAKR